MGKINLARVDDRLIHGQVMTKWSKGFGTNAIYVVDDETAADDFMKSIYVSTNTTAELKINVFTADEVVKKWKDDKFENDNVILLFKKISTAEQCINNGLEITELNIGGIAKKGDAKFVNSAVGLNVANAEVLKKINDQGIKVYFQIVPDSSSTSLEAALRKLKY